MRTQRVAVRLPVDLLATVDHLVAAGAYPSRAAAVRAGLEAIADAQRRRAVDDAVIDGYVRFPPTRLDGPYVEGGDALFRRRPVDDTCPPGLRSSRRVTFVITDVYRIRFNP